MRINKFLAENGIASRRHADEMVSAGRIKINGQTALLGADVQDGDEVLLDDKPIARSGTSVSRRASGLRYRRTSSLNERRRTRVSTYQS